MSKRPNPFGDSAPLQLKTHVGMKEIAEGCRRDEVMKEVFGKTQDKLFGAMNRNAGIMAHNDTQSRTGPAPSPLEWTHRFDPAQSLLDTTGHLVPPGAGWHNNNYLQRKQATPNSSAVFGATAFHAATRGREADSQESDMMCEEETNPISPASTMSNGKSPDSESNPQTENCGHFSGWMDCGNMEFRDATPMISAPARGGQMCLDFRGRLKAPQTFSMDCDSVPQSSVISNSLCSVAANGSHGSSSLVTNSNTNSKITRSPFLRAGPSSGLHEKKTDGAGGLQRWGFMSTKPAAKVASMSSGKCETCRQVLSSVNCYFCEKYVCAGCGRHCDTCSHLFCPLCSTLNYDTSTERAFCLSCVG